MSRPAITVVGSINMDLVIRCAQLPAPGETVLARSSQELCGGKGANQAVAAARAGGNVAMFGRVGDDAFAATLLDNMRRFEVNCDHVLRTRNQASGLAVVSVEDSGQNSITVVPGANANLSPGDVSTIHACVSSSDVVLLQLEIPIETVLAVIDMAKAAGVKVILDPAPVSTSLPDQLFAVDLLCPNETEATTLTGQKIDTPEDAARAGQLLRSRGAANVAITLGREGTMLVTNDGAQLIPPFLVQTVDTTAAGDAFAGCLGVYWHGDRDLAEAARYANAAGALCASREGAQAGMASRSEIEELCGSAGLSGH